MRELILTLFALLFLAALALPFVVLVRQHQRHEAMRERIERSKRRWRRT